jgi:hypothetical protein
VKKNSLLSRTVCLQFCIYYKPGKNEELVCRGYQVVERLMREGKQVIVERSGSGHGPAGNELVVQRLCGTCDFREDGCDFVLNRKAPPCGGLLLLAQLVAEHVVTVEDL